MQRASQEKILFFSRTRYDLQEVTILLRFYFQRRGWITSDWNFPLSPSYFFSPLFPLLHLFPCARKRKRLEKKEKTKTNGCAKNVRIFFLWKIQSRAFCNILRLKNSLFSREEGSWEGVLFRFCRRRVRFAPGTESQLEDWEFYNDGPITVYYKKLRIIRTFPCYTCEIKDVNDWLARDKKFEKKRERKKYVKRSDKMRCI